MVPRAADGRPSTGRRDEGVSRYGQPSDRDRGWGSASSSGWGVTAVPDEASSAAGLRRSPRFMSDRSHKKARGLARASREGQRAVSEPRHAIRTSSSMFLLLEAGGRRPMGPGCAGGLGCGELLQGASQCLARPHLYARTCGLDSSPRVIRPSGPAGLATWLAGL